MTTHLRTPAPIICIDGPTASGKGTVARAVADVLGFRYLDSGALYRLTGFAARQSGADMANADEIGTIARNLAAKFVGDKIYLSNIDVGDAIRAEQAGQDASIVAAIPAVRVALLQRQRDFAQAPGLVCDGRDMGTIVFTHAQVKVFLTASAKVRAERRTKQLKQKGISAILEDVENDLIARDARDSNRLAAPLVAANDAVTIDSTAFTASEIVAQIVGLYRSKVL